MKDLIVRHIFMNIIFTMFVVVSSSPVAFAQIDGIDTIDIVDDRMAMIDLKLQKLSEQFPEFSGEVDISVGEMSLTELLRNVARAGGVNLSADKLDMKVTCSFSKSRIDRLLLFLCKEYNLDIAFYGNIVSLSRYIPPVLEYEPPEIIWSGKDSLFSFDFEDKYLSDVARSLTDSSGINIIVPDVIRNMKISGKAQNATLADALTILTHANGLGYFLVPGQQKIWCVYKDAQPGLDRKPQGFEADRHKYMTQEDTALVYSMKFRSVRNLKELIPPPLTEGITLISSDELNSMIMYGNRQTIMKLEEFLVKIDVKIPLIAIDVMIVETSKSTLKDVGLTVGRRNEPTVTTGQIGDGIDLSIGTEPILSLLQRFDGFSGMNLGNVADNLYLQLKLLESRGLVTLQSTPKLSTLNGHEAILTKGETMYYKEINTSYLGSQNPWQTSSYNWKSVDADLTLKITPYVSTDSLITMAIDLSQSEFGSVSEENAPPEIKKRGFKSIVRSKEGDVVLLGGIDSSLTSDERKGLPGITGIPVLRWIFGGRKKELTETKLNVFIRPVII